MASPKKESRPIKIFWTKFTRKSYVLIKKIKGIVPVLLLPLKSLKDAYQQWPRLLQIGSIYLLALILAGAIYLWRSAQLRTINPYTDKIIFAEIEEGILPGMEGGNPVLKEPGDTAAVEPAITGPEVQPPEPLPQPVWPVQGKVLRKFDDSCLESLAPLDYVRRRKCKWIEIEAAPGAEIGSMLAGSVEKIIGAGYPGRALKIRHDNGLVAYYAAMDEIRVVEGQRVQCGENIGTVRQDDETALAYLYLEIWQEGRRIDPEAVLP